VISTTPCRSQINEEKRLSVSGTSQDSKSNDSGANRPLKAVQDQSEGKLLETQRLQPGRNEHHVLCGEVQL
jgi:hypothetical protein